MRTTLNKHLLEAFNLGESDSKRIRKPYRITSSLQNISTDIDSKATVFLKDYNNLRRGESSGRKLDDPNRKFKHRNCSARGDSMRQSLNYRDEIKRKDFSVMSRKLSEECFPYTVKALKRRSPSESRANMDTKVSSLDNLDSKNSTDRLHEKVKELLGRTEDKTFDHILESFDNDISKVKIKVSKDHSFNYRVLRLTETGSLDQEIKNLEERNIKKEIPKKKLRMVIRPKPQSKIDKILSQINILDDSLLTKHNGKGLNSTTISSRTGGQLTAKGPFSMNDLEYANENNTMTIPEMKNKLKEYGTIFHKQISAFKDSGMYLGLKQKEEIQKEIKEADRNLGINGTKRKLLVRKKFGDTIRKILLKMKKLRLSMNNIIKDNAIPTKPFQRHASEAFIKAAKEGDYSTIFEFLLWDEFLVHDFDPTRQTALHWATKRNYTKIMKHLLEKGADPDAKDIMGRTPLFIAAKNSNKTCVKLLLQFGADPLIRSDGGKRPIDYTYDFDVTHLLQRAAQMHIVMKVFPWKQYFIMWKNFNRREFEVQNVELGEVVFRSERDIGLA